jgi:hypothetical protein
VFTTARPTLNQNNTVHTLPHDSINVHFNIILPSTPRSSKTCLPFRFQNSRHTLKLYISVGFEVLTAVVMKSAILWDMPPCSPLLATCYHARFLLGSLFDPEDGGGMFLGNVG